jgi:UDP-GlcNAc:undecaprenyl-phosphate GlcNAc-1-phosphate transferase
MHFFEQGPVGHWIYYLLTMVLAGILAFVSTPRMREAAIRFGIVDRPDGRLKNHREPVPYLGGLAIYASFLLAVSIAFRLSEPVLGILLAGSLVVILGLIDDLGQLGPWTKLGGQLVAVLVLIKSGVYVQLTIIPYPLAVLLSVVWMLAVINAFNLIDIMDGLSAGTACVASLVLLFVAEWNGNLTAAVLLAAGAGACGGFLYYNFEPARIYMGDTGSMFLGLLLGSMAMELSYTERNALAAIAPGLILGVPLFDMLFVMYIRHRRGLPIMLGSPDHVALRLRKWRLTTRQTVTVSYAATALLGIAAVAMILLPLGGAWIAIGCVGVTAVVAGVWLNRIDMSL